MSEILQGDCFELIKSVPSESINLVITSPPFSNKEHTPKIREVGQEERIEIYIDKLLFLFTEMLRIIRHDGSIVINQFFISSRVKIITTACLVTCRNRKPS